MLHGQTRCVVCRTPGLIPVPRDTASLPGVVMAGRLSPRRCQRWRGPLSLRLHVAGNAPAGPGHGLPLCTHVKSVRGVVLSVLRIVTLAHKGCSRERPPHLIWWTLHTERLVEAHPPRQVLSASRQPRARSAHSARPRQGRAASDFLHDALPAAQARSACRLARSPGLVTGL